MAFNSSALSPTQLAFAIAFGDFFFEVSPSEEQTVAKNEILAFAEDFYGEIPSEELSDETRSALIHGAGAALVAIGSETSSDNLISGMAGGAITAYTNGEINSPQADAHATQMAKNFWTLYRKNPEAFRSAFEGAYASYRKVMVQ